MSMSFSPVYEIIQEQFKKTHRNANINTT